MTTTKPRRRGRPSTVTRERISKAVMSIAKEGKDVNMQSVAAKLKVDVATLYRHLGSQHELSRLMAEHAAPSPESLPDPTGKTAREWLHELAWFYWKLMRVHSDLMEYTQSAMDPKHEILEYVVGVLVEYGFTPRVASFGYHYLIDVLVGFIYQQIRDEEETARGGGRFISYQRNIAAQSGDQFPNILACGLGPADFEVENAFEMFLTFTLDGICAQLGK